MASLSGAQTAAAIKIASTWGTAVSVGAGNKIAGEFTANFGVEELNARTIGSGAYWLSNATRGRVVPTISFTGDLGYRNNCDVILAQMFGTAAAPSEVTGAQGDYKHTITLNTTLNAKYLTVVYESSSATVHEFPTCATRSVGFKSQSVPGYIDFTAEMLANNVVLSGPTNNNAAVIAATFTEGTAELTACDYPDTYRQNTQSGGAVGGGDQYNITGFDLQIQRPQETIGEIKGASGLSAPTATSYLDGTFTVTVKELADHAMYTIWSAETAQKAVLNIQGTQIGTGTNKTWAIYLPRMLLVTEPQYALTTEGTNPLTLNFRLLKASANPTGMSSTYPYFEVTNGLATSLLA
jgi:hypothetical protein